jgi:hypothetical protein
MSVFAREIPSTSLRAGTSLRLKNGDGQDDAEERNVLSNFATTPFPGGNPSPSGK